MNEEINVSEIYSSYLKRVEAYKKINAYYMGETDATLTYVRTDRSNLKVNCNYVKKFVKEEASYSVGNPITYSSKEENLDLINSIDSVIENFKENHDMNTFLQMVLMSKSYEVYYLDKWGDLQVKNIKAMDGYHIEDDEENTIAFIHVYHKTLYVGGAEEEVEYVDLYSSNEIKIYKHYNGAFVLEDTKVHYFGEVPVGVAKLSEDDWKDTIYNDIKGLQDALETNLSDIANEISDFRNAYLVLTGLSLEDEEAKNFKKKGIIEIPNSDGSASWLIKNINDTFIQNTLSTLQEKIYEITSHINHNDSQSMSNASGVALKSRLIALTQRCYINQNSYKELLKTRIRIIFRYLEIKHGMKFNWKDVVIKFTPLIPTDDVSNAALIQQLDGKLSASTGLELLSFIENGQAEYEKAQAEIVDNGLMDEYSEEEASNLKEELNKLKSSAVADEEKNVEENINE